MSPPAFKQNTDNYVESLKTPFLQAAQRVYESPVMQSIRNDNKIVDGSTRWDSRPTLAEIDTETFRGKKFIKILAPTPSDSTLANRFANGLSDELNKSF